jgi:hypothetical protein
VGGASVYWLEVTWKGEDVGCIQLKEKEVGK